MTKVFISWSGERSKAVAEALRDWLPDVIQALEPWLSDADIEKGQRWANELADELKESTVGIVCLTPENITSPWLNFEAGAISKLFEKSLVCPYLFGLDRNDLKGPLLMFQLSLANKEDTLALVRSINKELPEGKLTPERLDTAFENNWPRLDERLAEVKSKGPAQPVVKRGQEDMLEEILQRVRYLSLDQGRATHLEVTVDKPVPKDESLRVMSLRKVVGRPKDQPAQGSLVEAVGRLVDEGAEQSQSGPDEGGDNKRDGK